MATPAPEPDFRPAVAPPLVWLLRMEGVAGPRWGARCYNTIHSYLLPGALGAVALLLHRDALLPFALIWFNHIGVDRLCGYGLKYPTGFGDTHLSSLQRLAPK